MRTGNLLSPMALGLLLLACRGGGQARAPDPSLASATRFVETFYAWYVPAAQAGTGLATALGDSAHLFAPALAAALRADAAAQARAADEIVGLDGDPFLDAQDFCEVYHTGNARAEGAVVLVEVYGSCTRGEGGRPDVVAEVGPRDASWKFVNFRYPARHSDLRRDLEQLRRSREGK